MHNRFNFVDHELHAIIAPVEFPDDTDDGVIM